MSAAVPYAVTPLSLACGCISIAGYNGDIRCATITGAHPVCDTHRSGDTIPVRTHRVIVTGSRKWAHPHLIESDLENQLTYAHSIGAVLVVVHGKNPKGADAIAAAWCSRNLLRGAVEEPVPADWDRDCDAHCRHAPRTRNGEPYCPVAGVLRNQVMVDRGATLCLAYPSNDGTGTQDCMRRADSAKIPVYDRAAALFA